MALRRACLAWVCGVHASTQIPTPNTSSHHLTTLSYFNRGFQLAQLDFLAFQQGFPLQWQQRSQPTNPVYDTAHKQTNKPNISSYCTWFNCLRSVSASFNAALQSASAFCISRVNLSFTLANWSRSATLAFNPFNSTSFRSNRASLYDNNEANQPTNHSSQY